MTGVAARTVLFADLRGSTGLYEAIGNASATRIVTNRIARLIGAVAEGGGTVVKTLGDGLMASFSDAPGALRSADAMQRSAIAAWSDGITPAAARPDLTLQIALASGEVIEVGGDCYGDAVNIAARLLEHAGDHEILATADTVAQLSAPARLRFRSLDRIRLRGRIEPVCVHLLAPVSAGERAPPRADTDASERELQGIRISWRDQQQIWAPTDLPALFGRSPAAAFCIEDSRVSRQHARIDWDGHQFRLADLSCNGSFVRFGSEPVVLELRRQRCVLRGSGMISLGSPPADPSASQLRFDVLRFADTEPAGVTDLPVPHESRRR